MGLPDEILAIIISYIDKADLPDLRRVNSTFAELAAPRLFREIHLYRFRFSIERYDAIMSSQHAHHVKTLIVCPDILSISEERFAVIFFDHQALPNHTAEEMQKRMEQAWLAFRAFVKEQQTIFPVITFRNVRVEMDKRPWGPFPDFSTPSVSSIYPPFLHNDTVPIIRTERLYCDQPVLLHAASTLTHVKLYLDLWTEDDWYDGSIRRLSSASNLVDLIIHCTEQTMQDGRPLLLCGHWPKLKNLELFANMDTDRMIDILRTHHLQSLTLLRCGMTDVKAVLREIQACKLNAISIVELKTWEPPQYDHWFPDTGYREQFFTNGLPQAEEDWLLSRSSREPVWKPDCKLQGDEPWADADCPDTVTL